jgi:hypothetical protein
MGEELKKNTELRPEDVERGAEKPADLEVAGEEEAGVTGGRLRRGGDDDDIPDLEIQR